jgi:hypothetical protein
MRRTIDFHHTNRLIRCIAMASRTAVHDTEMLKTFYQKTSWTDMASVTGKSGLNMIDGFRRSSNTTPYSVAASTLLRRILEYPTNVTLFAL